MLSLAVCAVGCCVCLNVRACVRACVSWCVSPRGRSQAIYLAKDHIDFLSAESLHKEAFELLLTHHTQLAVATLDAGQKVQEFVQARRVDATLPVVQLAT